MRPLQLSGRLALATAFVLAATAALPGASIGATENDPPPSIAAATDESSPGERINPIAPVTSKKKPGTGSKKPGSGQKKPGSGQKKPDAVSGTVSRSTGPRVGGGRTASGAGNSESGTPTSNRASTILVAGDIAECDEDAWYSQDEATAALIEDQPGIVMTAGDNAYDKGTLREYKECYDPSWGSFLDRTRPTPGNHEYYTPGAAGYFSYFGERAGPPNRGFYTFKAGSWQVYALSSPLCEPQFGGCEKGSPQFEWLKKSLAAKPAECVLAVWHHPFRSSGRHGAQRMVKPLVRLLYAAGAEVIVNGHDHHYERFTPMRPNGEVDPQHGVRQFISGAGGGGLYNGAYPSSPNSEVFESNTYGVLRLKLFPGSYQWKFLPVEGKTFTDSGRGTCHGKP